MAKETDSALKFMTGGIGLSLEQSVTHIETVTRFLDNHFEGLEASKLPEYQRAIDALRAYQEALVAHFSRKYNESVSSEPTQEQRGSAEKLINRDTLLGELLSDPNLGFLGRGFTKILASLSYRILAKYAPNRFDKFKECFERGAYPQTPGWEIMKSRFLG